MNNKDYQRPEILVVSIRQTHIVCGTLNKGVQDVSSDNDSGITFTEGGSYEDDAEDY